MENAHLCDYKHACFCILCDDVVSVESYINHYQESDLGFAHKVFIDKNSRLYSIIGKDEILVNSFHKRCISENNIYKVTAKSEDGIIEAIENKDSAFNIGVQWHPELMPKEDENSNLLFDRLIEEAKVYRKRK